MKLIVCLDNNNGMLFNRRRLSRDSTLCRHVLDTACGAAVWMNAYSRQLFEGLDGNICGYDGDLSRVKQDEYLFAEDLDVAPLIPMAEEIILYRWNRTYPSDVKFPVSVLDTGWRLVCRQDFSGHSHEKLTQEVYRR